MNVVKINGYMATPMADDDGVIVSLTAVLDPAVGEEDIEFVYRPGVDGPIAEAIAADIAANNPTIEPAPDPLSSLTEADYTRAIQSLLDEAATERRYTSGDTMATYINSTNSIWAAEAQAFVKWRDAVWLYAYQQLAAVTAGERTKPTVEELLAELPTANWPA